jgi:predicted DNA repair protein MutK
MATSLLLLLDDIASVLDDVALLTKAAAKKTAGVIGDDLALNAHQVAGVDPGRELRVVWRVALGSLANKAILVPAALALSWLAPWAVSPLLVLGGVYLCFEGMEKILHRARRHAPADAPPPSAAESAAAGDTEATKIGGAIRTDFILSAEIIVITLGIVAGQPPGVQVAVLSIVALAMTVGVYGAVAGIVRLDDLGLALAAGPRGPGRALGRAMLATAPWLLRALSVAGTAAMFIVGGGILAHAIPALHAFTTPRAHHDAPAWWAGPATLAAEATVGMAAGLVALGAWRVAGALRGAASQA